MDKHGGERERACGAESSHGALAAEIAKLREDKAALLAATRGLMEWYAGLPEPGEVPSCEILGARLREARAAIAWVERK